MLLSEQPEEDYFEDIEDFDDAIEAWEERWEPVMWSADRTVGAVVISTLGCAAREWLIISGPDATGGEVIDTQHLWNGPVRIRHGHDRP